MNGDTDQPPHGRSRPVSYAGVSRRFSSVLYEPPAGPAPRPGVVILHGLFGLQQMDSDFAADLGALGYVTLVHGWQTEDPDPPDDDVVAGVAVAASWLRERDGVHPDRLALIGICRGGSLALLSAAGLDSFRAVASFYGQARYPGVGRRKPVSPLDCLDRVTAPVLLVHGEDDSTFPVAESRALARRLQDLDKPHRTAYVAGAEHGFFLRGHRNYHPRAAARVWPELTGFLEEALRSEPGAG